jgi:hypothetical protein
MVVTYCRRFKSFCVVWGPLNFVTELFPRSQRFGNNDICGRLNNDLHTPKVHFVWISMYCLKCLLQPRLFYILFALKNVEVENEGFCFVLFFTIMLLYCDTWTWNNTVMMHIICPAVPEAFRRPTDTSSIGYFRVVYAKLSKKSGCLLNSRCQII